jgi:hypothetical protein
MVLYIWVLYLEGRNTVNSRRSSGKIRNLLVHCRGLHVSPCGSGVANFTMPKISLVNAYYFAKVGLDARNSSEQLFSAERTIAKSKSLGPVSALNR